MDHEMVVEPAEKHQILLVGSSTLRPGCLVVSLEPVSGVASVGGAESMKLVDERPFQGRGYGPRLPAIVQIPAVFGSGQNLGVGVAKDGL
jgi:hypothetical protein